MFGFYVRQTKLQPIIIEPISSLDFPMWISTQPSRIQTWLQRANFTAQANSHCVVFNNDGEIERVFAGNNGKNDFWQYAFLAKMLPPAIYVFADSVSKSEVQNAAVAWGLASYRFDRYKANDTAQPTLLLSHGIDTVLVENTIQSIFNIRDLINTPTEDMGPEELAESMSHLAHNFGAQMEQVIGHELLKKGYPAIHAVGRASDRAPRLMSLTWGEPSHPKLTLVGKGVCFDTGGLDIKSSAGMRLMKKDMGGAAHVLGLAQMIMAAKLPVRLRVIIPAVENAISGNAYRPGDVIKTRKGLTIEIGNTDAEGRVILADALTEAMFDRPRLVIDFATLTGAARIALGTEVPVMFCNNDELAQALATTSVQVQDPVWRLPLHKPYRDLLDSKIADMSNDSSSSYGGAITAALFLNEFVDAGIDWIHFDVMAWNLRERAGRPEGGDAMGIRAVFAYLQQKFSQ